MEIASLGVKYLCYKLEKSLEILSISGLFLILYVIYASFTGIDKQ